MGGGILAARQASRRLSLGTGGGTGKGMLETRLASMRGFSDSDRGGKGMFVSWLAIVSGSTAWADTSAGSLRSGEFLPLSAKGPSVSDDFSERESPFRCCGAAGSPTDWIGSTSVGPGG
ncbi:MAG: hypothetical protein NVSMB9_09730 [Isosphaeraceae bacterium]